MINRNLTIFLILFFILQSLLTGCGDKEKPLYRIGVSQCSDDDWRRKLNEEIQRELLFHDDAVADIRSADDDNEKQISDIEYFITEGYDIILAAPNQADALTPVLKKAYSSGIPVVIFDRGIQGDSYTSFIEFDNHGIGLEAADYAVRHLPTGGKVVELCGLSGSTPAADRHAGFAEGLAGKEKIELLPGVDGEWKREIARLKMDSILRQHPDLKLVYAHNDLMAIGASEVLKEMGRRDIIVLGTDAAPNVGMKAVEDGVIDATFIYPTDGQRLIQTAMAILKGEPYRKNEVSPALPPVDHSNAKILRRQQNLLSDQTEKILLLKEKNDDVTNVNKTQTLMLYMAFAVGALLIIIVVMLLWYFWQRVRIQRMLTKKNDQLQAEKEKQEELYRQLDEATKAKLAFFTNVSHDLRTPLTLISEPVERLASADYLSSKDKFLMKIAHKNVMILRRMIDQILDFRSYESGKTSLCLSEVKILNFISDWVASFRGIADKRNIRLNLETAFDGNETLALDIDKIESVFFNLVSNAFKYSPDNTTINIDCRLDGKGLSIRVADQGYGLKEEDKNKIFDYFYRADKVRSNGSGIGLALAKAFIELHDGSLTVESIYGKGSTFSVYIPVKHVNDGVDEVKPQISEKEVYAELSEIAMEDHNFKDDKPLLLFIDDNPDIRNLAEEILSAEYNVITARDGRAGLKLANRYVPDIVICDILMPVMDGLEFCRLLKKELPTSHIPVLILTASPIDERRMESYEKGADGFLSKPFNSAMLLSRCRNLLDNRRRIKNLYEKMLPAYSTRAQLPGAPANSGGELKDSDNGESEFYQKFLSVVRENFANPDLNTSDIGSNLGLGPAQLTRKIKALTNYSPIEILKNYRLKKVKELLISTEKNISEIAYESGFSSPPYLSKCFKDAYGETPTEYRTRILSTKK